MPEMFDYIVVGGGTAGMAVASRLSEDPALTVLVLEAGGTGVNNTGISIPGLVGTTLGTDVDWKYSTVPQSGANQRQVYYPRGKVLGGSSAINFLINTKAEKNDYNAIETSATRDGDAIDAMSGRVTSATAYYLPIQSRSNLVVRTDALVSKLISKRTEGQALQVVGVEYSSFGTVSRAMVNKEVIMSSGSIGTPAILERSY
ncbi:hypothetical protein H4Q26_012531 [Puccinia striiformis f. sp. tritici PST-130]|nr:hypothetical protein H4Q26_012531 [Puccinia striiformis f. sp. tritici PST-130]